MVGTSLDALDACIVDLPAEDDDAMPTLRGGCAVPFRCVDPARIRAIAEGESTTAEEIAGIATALAADHETAVREAARRCEVEPDELRYVSVHGVTMSHRPKGDRAHSWQLIDAQALAARLRTLVIADLRAADVALGGEGAPLAPVVDRMLRASATHDRIVLNLGGIANLSLLPAGGGRVWAADIGPANMPLDLLWRADGRDGYDVDGKTARRGSCLPELRDELLAEAWVRAALPRSFGREQFGQRWIDGLVARSPEATLEDRLATVVAVEAEAMRIFLADVAPSDWRSDEANSIELYLTGGGVHHRALFDALAGLDGVDARSIAELGEDPDLKEAFDFAVLGWLRVLHRHAGAHETSGASADAVLGSIHFPDPKDS